MAQEILNIGAAANDRSGDDLRSGGIKINNNFTALYLVLTSVVYVVLPEHLPAAVLGRRLLEDNTRYIVAAHIDIGADEIDYGTNSEIVGYNSAISSLTSSTAGVLLNAASKTLRVSCIGLSCPNGDLFAFTGTALTAYIIKDVISLSHVNVGTFTNVFSGIFELCSFALSVNGITFAGTGAGNSSIRTCRFIAFSGTAVDYGTAVMDSASQDTVFYSGLGGSTSISGLAAGANFTVRLLVNSCTFNGSGTPLVGIDVNDLKVTFMGNTGSGIPTTKAAVGMFVANNATVTAISGGSGDAGNPIKVDVGVSGAFYKDSRFTVSTSGTITSNSLDDIDIVITYSIYADVASGTNKVFSFYVAKNGTEIPGSKATRSFDAANPGAPGPIQAIVTLSTNDTIDLFLENTTDTTNMTVIDASCVGF